MTQTGQVVNLEVAKQGAIHHGLAALLCQPSPLMHRGRLGGGVRVLSGSHSAQQIVRGSCLGRPLLGPATFEAPEARLGGWCLCSVAKGTDIPVGGTRMEFGGPFEFTKFVQFTVIFGDGLYSATFMCHVVVASIFSTMLQPLAAATSLCHASRFVCSLARKRCQTNPCAHASSRDGIGVPWKLLRLPGQCGTKSLTPSIAGLHTVL